MNRTRYSLMIAMTAALWGVNVHAAAPVPIFVANAEEVSALSADGQHQLALALLDTLQPVYDERSRDDWLRWEQQRLDVLRDAGDWQALLARLDSLPVDLPETFQRHAATHRAEALLMSGRPVDAQQQIAGLIWGPLADTAMLPIWRGLLIRSYLAQAAYQDAATASERYHQDYGIAGGGLGAHGLARHHILAGQLEPAMAALQGHHEEEAQALRWLLDGRRDRLDAHVLTQIRQSLNRPGLSADLRGLYWQVLREDAARRGDQLARVEALEQLLLVGPVSPVNAGLYTVGADELWRAYRALAEQITNAAELLVGDQSGWMALASSLKSSESRQARAMYGALSQLADEPMQRQLADIELMTMLASEQQYTPLLPVLYRQSSRFPVFAELPLLLQQVLINQAIKLDEYDSASQMLQLATPEVFSEDAIAWQLQAARVHVFAGNSSLAAPVLGVLADRYDVLAPDQQMALLAVLGELSVTRSGDLALTIWQQMKGKLSEDIRLPRVARLLADLTRYQDAARHFLLAAQLPLAAEQRWDYRRQAADMLARAGLDQDARALYQRLLGQTSDPQRVDLVRERLHGLR